MSLERSSPPSALMVGPASKDKRLDLFKVSQQKWLSMILRKYCFVTRSSNIGLTMSRTRTIGATSGGYKSVITRQVTIFVLFLSFTLLFIVNAFFVSRCLLG